LRGQNVAGSLDTSDRDDSPVGVRHERKGMAVRAQTRHVVGQLGGSVGAMYYLDAWGKGAGAIFDPAALDEDAEGNPAPNSIRWNSQASSLEAAAWGVAYPDLMRLLFPPLVSSLDDRGWRIEADWASRLADPAVAAALFDAAEEYLGPVDILVNNAGIFPRVPFLEMAERDWDSVLDVNLKGSCFCAQAAARAMIAGGRRGSIINLSSSSVRGQPRGVHYTASKGGVITMTRTMALELAPHGIRVNAIGPGSIMTEILKAVATDKEAKRRLLARTPLGRIGEPDEVASVALFLASAEASYITGQTLLVDGGLVLNLSRFNKVVWIRPGAARMRGGRGPSEATVSAPPVTGYPIGNIRLGFNVSA